jgi:hypothetical protein
MFCLAFILRICALRLHGFGGPAGSDQNPSLFLDIRHPSIRAQEVVRNAGTWEQEHGEIDSSGKGELVAIEILFWRRGQGVHEQEYDSAWAFGV